MAAVMTENLFLFGISPVPLEISILIGTSISQSKPATVFDDLAGGEINAQYHNQSTRPGKPLPVQLYVTDCQTGQNDYQRYKIDVKCLPLDVFLSHKASINGFAQGSS